MEVRRQVGRRSRRLMAGILALALVGAGCSGSDSDPEEAAVADNGSESTSGEATDTAGAGDNGVACDTMETVSFGMISPSAGYWLPLYAEAAGLWADNCIELDLVTIANAANLLTAVGTNDLQLTVVPSANGFAGIEAGTPVVAVASNQDVNNATFVARPEITSLEDLRGRTIGTASVVSTATLGMTRILEDAGVSDGEYEIIAGGGSAERQTSLSEGAYDATWLLSPNDLLLLDEGYTNLGTLGDAFPGDVYACLFAGTGWATDNPELMTRVLDVWVEATERIHDPEYRDAFEQVLVDDAGATPELAAQTYDRYAELSAISPDGRVEGSQAYVVLELMNELGTLDEIPDDASAFIDMSYWAEATGNPEPDLTRP